MIFGTKSAIYLAVCLLIFKELRGLLPKPFYYTWLAVLFNHFLVLRWSRSDSPAAESKLALIK
jgi:hypothetical protein